MSAVGQPSALCTSYQAYESLPIAICVIATDAALGAIRYCNDSFTKLTGRYLQDFQCSTLLSLHDPSGEGSTLQQLRTALHHGDAFASDWLIRRADEAQQWVRVSFAARTCKGADVIVTLQDIGEHKHARETLRATEARLEIATDAYGLAMWDWNVVRDEVYYNEHWRSALGIHPEHLLNRTELAERLALPTDQPKILERFEQLYRGHAHTFRADYQIKTANEAGRWVSTYAKVVRRDSQGAPQRIIGVLRDISAQMATAGDAALVEQRWARAIRGTSDGLYDWNLLTGHVWYAARFREIVGYSAEDFPDTFHAFQNVLHASDRAMVMGKIRAHLEHHERLDVRCRVVSREGEILWCRLRGYAERDAAGRPLRIAGALSDISAQVEAEEALRHSQAFYGTILDSLPLFIAYSDRDRRLVYANRPFQDFFSVPLASSRGRVINDVIGDRRYGAIGPYVERALSGTAIEGQGRFRDASGRVLDLDAAFLPHREDNGEVQGCIVAARDMTEKRQLEAELRQSQKMEAVGRLTGGIAHDFNNLLSVVVGNMQLLMRSLQQSPRLLRQSEVALSAALRGADLTRRLLAFARQQVLEPKTLDLNSLIGGMYELLRRTLTGDIEIRQQLDPTVWPTKADPGQLENAVLNLVINARDAMPNGGTIKLITRNVSVTSDRAARDDGLANGEYAVLEVVDNGLGMTAQTLKRVFEPFFTTKDVGKGSGLGLSMVYGFVKQSGGHIHITSAPNQGTTVHMYFPRTHARADVRPAAMQANPELPRGQETVMVVEDNAEVRATTVDILTSLGYRVLQACNGHQALERFVEHPEIALVFSDVMLPGGLLGTQLVQKLTERRPGLKVLMTSGFSESGIMDRQLLDGRIELLQKPYRLEDLARRIRAKLDGIEENDRVPA
jgi:PAS domain S-box-containing protein